MRHLPAQTLRVARAAARRAFVADALGLAGRALLLGSAAGLVLVALDRLAGGIVWWPVLLVVPVALGVAAALTFAILRRWSTLHAAAELDRRLALKDTLASAIQFADAREGEGAFSSWTIAEAERRAADVQVRRIIPMPIRWHWAAWPALCAAAVAAGLFLPALDWGRPTTAVTTGPARDAAAEQVRIAQTAARSVLEDTTPDAAASRELEALEELQRELEAGSADPAQAAARAARQLEELSDTLQSQSRTEQATRDVMRERLAAAREAARRQDRGEPGPRERDEFGAMADAISRGDFETAAELARQAMNQEQTWSAEERRRAAEELEELAEAIRRAARHEETQPPEPPGATDPSSPREEPRPTEPEPTEPEPAEPAEPEPAEPEHHDPQQPEELDTRTDPREIERDLREQGLDAEQAQREAERRAEENRQRLAEERARERLDQLERNMRDTARDLREDPSPQPETRPDEAQPEPEERPQPGEEQQDRPGEPRPGEPQPGEPEPGEPRPDPAAEPQPGEPRPDPAGEPQPGEPRPDPAAEPQPGEPEPGQDPQPRPGQEPGTEPQPGQPEPGQPGQDPVPQPQPGEPDPGAQPQPVPQPDPAQPGHDPQPGEGEEGMQPAPQPDAQPGPQPDAQPDARGIERLRRAFEQLSEEGRRPEQMHDQSERLRDMAERMLRDMSPEERQELQRMAEEMQRDQPRAPAPAAGEDPARETAAAPTAPHVGETDPVDARPAPRPGETPRERVLAEWFGEGEDPDGIGQGVPAEAMREAAESAQRAVEQQPIPPRYSDLVRRVFRRYAEDQ